MAKNQMPKRCVTDVNDPGCLVELQCFNDKAGSERQESNMQ